MSFSHNSPAAVLPWLAKSLLVGGDTFGAEKYVATSGAPAAVGHILRSVVAVGVTSNSEWGGAAAGDYKDAVLAFENLLKVDSFFYRAVADGAFVRLPLNVRIGIMTANATGFVVGEGRPVPISRLAVANTVLLPIKAAAMIVVSNELVRSTAPAAMSAFSQALRSAVARVVDEKVFSEIIDEETPFIFSNGALAEDMLDDLRALLAAVPSEGGKLYFVASESVAKAASTFPEHFPAMSPTGGEMLNVPCLVSAALGEGKLVLVNAAQIVGVAETIDLRSSGVTSIEMNAPPLENSSATASSMWQSDTSALMATATFGVERLADDAVAVLEGVAWGGAVPTL